MNLRVLAFLALLCAAPATLAALSRATVPTSIKAHANVQAAPNYAVQAVIGNLRQVRTIIFDSEGDLLAVARGDNQIVAVYEDPVGSDKYKSTVIVSASTLGLNHGLAIRDGYLYASSSDTVYRWPYVAKQRKRVTTAEQVVISKITPGAGSTLGANQGHSTRTIAFSPDNQYMYVSIGSRDNIDKPDTGRAMVRRFNFPPVADESQRKLPIEFSSGDLYADGLRNAVALGFDRRGRLWEADNGPDNFQRSDLGKDIHTDNPAEEINLLDGPVGKKYGYPFCVTGGNLTKPFLEDPIRGQQYNWPDSGKTDAWCRDPANNAPPLATIPAHSAPLNLYFYPDNTTSTNFNKSMGCDSGPGAFPCQFANDLFVALHGSWNANLPHGYKVSHLPFAKTSPYLPIQSGLEDIIWMKNYQTKCATQQAANSCFRPAGITFDSAGTMWVASQETNELVRVFYLKNGAITVTN